MSDDLINELLAAVIPEGYPYRAFRNYVANCVPLRSVLASAGLLLPKFEDIDGSVFLMDREVPSCVPKLETRFGSDRITIERYFNMRAIGDFYLLAEDEDSRNEELLYLFAKTLEFFWRTALRCEFPEKKFEFEIANKMYDEDCLCITFWQE